ncbi:TMV resistance protein N-like isoform X2 [Lycium barbarum]|uniref:TMV resistance protein N-like isoform X2 n=1 Tax=Lycium barbarum TaxID=112863 RepID=UPI00293F3CF1|nr:TMV resistance protein N-like isoform X2 [Lycium barbarum]
MAFNSRSSLPHSERWDYDVFLSFRGEDTRKTFVGHLYRELSRAGINTFKDDETLKSGASISPQLVSSIKRSRFSILVFSKNYASSKWCLDELSKIIESRHKLGQEVVPIFYDISPSEVRSQRNSFADAFSRYEEDFKGDTKKVHNWRNALYEAANLAGHDLHSSTYNGNESMCIQHIVKEISNELCRNSMSSGKLVVAESQIRAVCSLLMMECEDVRFIGISGMGGIGKTTIARAIFDRFSHQFEGACFVANIKENQAKQGLLSLQKNLVSEVLTVESVNIANEYSGIDLIRKRLGSKKVIVVLDDVDHQDQLDGLAGDRDWFGKGSRIIITARDNHLLWNCCEIYKLSQRVVQYAGGLPLALKVLGSFLFGRSMKQWRNALDKLKDTPNDEIISKLRISYDGLGDAEKQVFLDLACSFIPPPALIRKLHPEITIDVLVEKSLLFESSFERIGMHDLIREMGRRIALQECPRHRIWLHEDIADVLTENKGREAVEVIQIPLKSNSEEDSIHLSNEVLRHMKRLRIFLLPPHKNFMHLCAHEPINFLPNSLCWFDWSYYPSPSLPKDFGPPKLVGLIMCRSYLVNLWKGSKHLNRLTLLNLSDSQKLMQIPDLSGSPNLERLFLSRCTQLVEVHQSVGAIKKLTFLDVEGCEKLERLPAKFQSGSLEILNASGCRSLRRFPEIQQNVNRLSELRQPYCGVSTSSFEHVNVASFLDLRGCIHIETLPSSICRLKNLKFLYLNGCSKLKNLPENIGDLENLEGLDASETAIWRTPNSIIRLRKLKFLSFRKVPRISPVRDLCSWGCFAQYDLNFQLPSVLSVFCTLERLDLSACNLFDGTVPEDLGCLASLLELNLSRNGFTYLPKSIAQLNRLKLLDVTYCEKLKELPELPPSIVNLFADDRFALQSIQTLPTMYKKLYLVSFANRKMHEMWCASRGESSCLKMENCPRENMIDMLQDILPIFFSMLQLKSQFDYMWKSFCIVLSRHAPRDKVPRWFKYRETRSTMISIKLKEHWYNDKFMGFALYCRFPSLIDCPPRYNQYRQSAFCHVWGTTVKTKLVPKHAAMGRPTLENFVNMGVSSAVSTDFQDCLVFCSLKLDKMEEYFKGKGKDPLLVINPNDYCRFEASLDGRISTNWGIRLVYADDIEVMRLKWTRKFKIDSFSYLAGDKEFIPGIDERLGRLLVPQEIGFLMWRLLFDTLPVLPTCPRCLSFTEDFNHAFLNCKYSQLVWVGSRLGLNFEVGNPVPVQEWLTTWISSAPQDEDVSFAFAVLWAIWKHRNKVVHERAVFVPSEVISTAIEEHSRFPNSKSREEEALKEGPRETAVDLKALFVDFDVQQDDDMLVIEVKGAWKEGKEWAGVAWLAFNKQGVKVAAARKSLKVISRLHAEVHAFDYAMRWAATEVSKVIILSDNGALIEQLLCGGSCSDQDIVYMLREFLELMKEEEMFWKVVKVPSYAVSAAKRAAKMAMKTYMDVLNSVIW